MSSLLLNLDQHMFEMINHTWQSTVLDAVMVFLSAKLPWAILLVFWIAYLIKRRHWQILRFLLVCGLVVGLADFTAHTFLKPFFGRIRPCKVLETVRIIDGCAGTYSFPSNHATNAAVVVTLIWAFAPGPFAWFATVMAFLVGLSRVYLGVHYPLDILAGFVYGSLIGSVFTIIFRRFSRTPRSWSKSSI